MTLQEMETEHAALLDPMDIRGDRTPRERDAYDRQRHALAARIRTVRAATETLAEVAPEIATLTTWRTHLDGWRQTLCDELLAMEPRDVRQQNMRLSIQTVDRGRGILEGTGYMVETLRLGALMRESGYVPASSVDGAIPRLPWLGSMFEVEHRLRELQKRRDEAQRQLDSVLAASTV